jgi:hypothetical protein
LKGANLAKVIRRKAVRDARIEALQMLGRWTSLGQAHVLMGAGCTCGVAGGSMRVEEFEQQILDYLAGKHAAARQFRSLGELLRSIAAPRGGEPGAGLSLLDDLKRTLDSFDELHRSRR